MKVSQYLSSTAFLLALGVQSASGTTLGTIEFERSTNRTSPFIVDLGGVNASPDAIVTLNQFNGASTLSAGLASHFDIHLDRAFLWDDDPGTADTISDRRLFELDASTLGSRSATNVSTTLTLLTGVNTGMDNVRLAVFELDAAGNLQDGTLGSSLSGTIRASLAAGMNYLLHVAGNLRADTDSTTAGRYDIVYGTTVIPLPPAILLFLSGLAAIFGIRRLRKDATDA